MLLQGCCGWAVVATATGFAIAGHDQCYIVDQCMPYLIGSLHVGYTLATICTICTNNPGAQGILDILQEPGLLHRSVAGIIHVEDTCTDIAIECQHHLYIMGGAQALGGMPAWMCITDALAALTIIIQLVDTQHSPC